MTKLNKPLTILKQSIGQVTKQKLGKKWKPDEETLSHILDEYQALPKDKRPDIADLNNPKGIDFLTDTTFLLADVKRRFKSVSDTRYSEIGDVYDALRKKMDPLEFMRLTQQKIFDIAERLSKSDKQKIKKLSAQVSNEYGRRWGSWQQVGEGLIRHKKDHKAIFRAWPVSMEELSGVHQNVEALKSLNDYMHMFSLGNKSLKPNKLAGAIKEQSQTLTDSTALSKMLTKPTNTKRPDIPSDFNVYQQQWRELRKDRERDIVATLKDKYQW